MDQQQELEAMNRPSTFKRVEMKWLAYFKVFCFMVKIRIQFIRDILGSHICNL